MRQPVQNSIDGEHLAPVGQGGPVDHDDGQAQFPRGRDLGHSARAAGILRDDKLCPMVLHQGAVACYRKRPAIHDDLRIWQRQGRLWRIDQPKQVAMLRVRREFGQMHPAHGQHHPRCRAVQRRNRASNVPDVVPVIPRLRRPRRAAERDQRNVGLRAGCDGVAAHLCGKGMGGVHNMADPVVFQISPKPLDTAKPADPQRQGLPLGARDTAGQRQRARYAGLGQTQRQGRGFCRASKDKEVCCHG